MNIPKALAVIFALPLALVFGLGFGNREHLAPEDSSRFNSRRNSAASGDPQSVEHRYERWKEEYDQAGGYRSVVIGLGWSKGLSKQFTKAAGRAEFNGFTGVINVAIDNLPTEAEYNVWLVDNQSGPGRSLWPEPGDRLFDLGTLENANEVAWLRADLGPTALEDFELNLIVVAEAGMDPSAGGLLYGMPTLFQDRYMAEGKQAIGPLAHPGLQAIALPRRGAPSPALKPFSELIELGEKLFVNEEFEGNGRACATCHPASNNFTLDQHFIACLPDEDPLFVAENIPALATLERPELMRKAALILENTNGFGDLENDFQMRGVQHTLGLSQSITPAIFDDGSTTPPDQRLGWSGDGAPVGPVRDSGFVGAGTLKHFTVGAIVQHLPRTLARRFHPKPSAKPDFRLPTDLELVALEAFQLSLGRQEELVLSSLSFANPVAERGRLLFSESQCIRCHEGAGANADVGTGNPIFDIGVDLLPDAIGVLVDPENILEDDGFGSPGQGRFNVQSLIEAADTGPFFHNNALNTVETAVSFYNTTAFNHSQGATFLGDEIDLQATEVIAVAAFLRTINVQQNIHEAVDFIQRASATIDPDRRSALFRRAADEVQDAAEVLEEGQLDLEVAKLLRTVLEWLNALSDDDNLISPAASLEFQALNELKGILDQIVN